MNPKHFPVRGLVVAPAAHTYPKSRGMPRQKLSTGIGDGQVKTGEGCSHLGRCAQVKIGFSTHVQ